MECGQLGSGLKWTAFTEVTIEDSEVNDNYLITYPDSDDSVNEPKMSLDNPLFIPAREVLKGEVTEISEDLLNDFQEYNLEVSENEPVVYLSSSRAAKLQRALKIAGYKKVCIYSEFHHFCRVDGFFYECI